MSPVNDTPDQLRQRLQNAGYLAGTDLSTAVWLAGELQRPLLLEGDAGVGKTALAQALASVQGAELVRLQCFEGLDLAQAAYEWNYSRQLLSFRAAETSGDRLKADDVFSRSFLLERPLLKAISNEGPCVLLIDEIDRADDEFEAYLLEVLSDFQVTIPELGTFKAPTPPIVILTSNRTRDVHDALKRRCLYHWIEHPTFDREVAIVRLRVPQVAISLARQVAAATEAMRGMQLYKPPGVAETIDWATALGSLGIANLDEDSVRSTLGAVLKYREDQERVETSGMTDLIKSAVQRALGT